MPILGVLSICLIVVSYKDTISFQCLQWAHGFDQKFGLYAWEPGMGSRREIRAATPLLANIYKDLAAQVPTTTAQAPFHIVHAAHIYLGLLQSGCEGHLIRHPGPPD